MSQKIPVYGSPLCGTVLPVRNLLDRAEASYEYIDILRSAEGKEQVRQINHGNESVPTIVFTDDSTLTEPSLSVLQTKLETLGYKIQPRSWQDWLVLTAGNPTLRLSGIFAVVFGLISGNNLLVGAGASVVGLSLLVGFLNR
jgi:mycoredoxin